jgi:hypothetical protein
MAHCGIYQELSETVMVLSRVASLHAKIQIQNVQKQECHHVFLPKNRWKDNNTIDLREVVSEVGDG